MLATLQNLLRGADDLAIVSAAERFAAGKVPGQSKKFAPSTPEFCDEVENQRGYIDLMSRPRIAPPAYRSGPLSPFELKRQKAFADNAHLPVLFESVTYDEFRKMSAQRQIPTGAKWVAILGTVYGPDSKQSKAA